MTKPTDLDPEKNGLSQTGRFKLREGGHVSNPSFKEVFPDGEVPAHRYHAKHIQNPQDRKNIIYGMLAVVVVLVILILLEFKQLHDAETEKALQSGTSEQAK